MSRRLLAFVMAAGLAACNGITPTAPAPGTGSGTAQTAATINIVPSPAQLPAAGGVSTLFVEVLSSGGSGVRDAAVTLTTSAGQLSATTLRTDSTGHGTTEWSGNRTGRITATLGELTTSATIEVGSTGPAPPNPGPGPGPGPGPPPPPPGPGPPAPPPGPPPPPPGPPGDLVLTITPSRASPNASQSVTWTASLSSSTGGTVPFIDRYGWDLNGDGLVDRTESAPSITYPEGSYTAFLQVGTSDNRAVTATRFISVAPAPVLSATLSAAPSTADLDTSVTFTATTSRVGDTGEPTSFVWNLDNGADPETTTANSRRITYSTLGTKTARVTVTSENGQTATATTTVTVSAPPLVVGLNASGTQTVGSSVTFTATVTSTGTGLSGVPRSMTFEWDYDGAGGPEEVTTGASPRSVGRIYNQTGTYTVKVTVKATDGRTATNSTTVTITR